MKTCHRLLMVFVGSVTLIALLAGFAAPSGSPAHAQDGPRPVIIDTDLAADDWLAILYLLQRPDVSVKAITLTGAGEVHCDPGVANAMKLVALATDEAIPVACGRETPLAGDHTFPAEWRVGVDALYGIELPDSPHAPVEQTAVELLTSIAASSPEKVSVLTLGPVTNVAEALQADPTLADKLENIVIMGGAVNVAGNLDGYFPDNTTAEWNIYVDPVAANIVLASGAPVTLVTLDVKNHAPLTLEFYDRFDANRATPEAEFVFTVISIYRDWGMLGGGWYFWDPMAAAVLSDDTLVTFETYPLRVVEEEGAESGRVVVDDTGAETRVAINVDAARFEEVFISTLNDGAPVVEAVPADAEPATPEPGAPVASAGEITGVWKMQTFDFHFLFRDDGTYVANQSFAGLTGDAPEDLGTYTVEGGVLTLISGPATRFCKPGETGSYNLYLSDAGELVFVVREDQCSMRAAPPGVPQFFGRVE